MPNSIRDLGESEYLKLLVYGRWSVGKTVLIGTAGPRCLIVRPPVDHTDSIIARFPKAKRPKEWVVRDWDAMEEVKQYLRLQGGDWEWVWLDSISLWQDVGLDDIWAATIERNPSRNAKHAGLDKGEYGRNMDRLSGWVRDVVALDTFHFGITAHPTHRLDAPDGERKMMPWVQGKQMSEKTCGYMNVVGYLDVKRSPSSGRVYRELTVNETEDFYAKDQFEAFEKGRMIDPTLPKIVAAVEAAKRKSGGGAAKTKTGGGKRRAA